MNRFLILSWISTLILLFFPKYIVERWTPSLNDNPRAQTSIEIITEVNKLRAIKNVLPYSVNSILMGISQTHAVYLANKGLLTHFSASGSRPFQRANAAGYFVAGDLSSGGFFSENILSGINLTSKEVVAKWQLDPENLNTLISPDYKDIGVGIAQSNGLTFYVLDAGASVESLPSTTPTLQMQVIPVSSPENQSSPSLGSTSVDNEDVVHKVEPNETLWSIAKTYSISVEQLKQLNKLATDKISVGQSLLIKRNARSTSTFPPPVTATFGIPTSTATIPVEPTSVVTFTPLPVPPASIQGGGMIVVLIILGALAVSGLGSWLAREK